MSKYTAEQVIHAADLEQARYDGDLIISGYLRDYAALLRKRESEKAVVTDVLSPVTLAVIGRKHFGNPIPKEWYAAAKELLARSLEAVAPMLTRARAPDGYTALLSDGKRYWSDKPGQHGEWLPYYLGVPVDGYVMPKGWQLVPAELTLSMSVRGKWALCDHSIKPEDFKRAWREMLAAAPKPTNVWPVDAREKAFSLAREMLQKGSAKPETEE